jgi:hypothetical protein
MDPVEPLFLGGRGEDDADADEPVPVPGLHTQ